MSKIVSHDYHGNEHLFDEADYLPHQSVYAVCILKGEVLMVQDSKSGRWELPGGGVEDGENEVEGLKREVHEETGLTITEPIRVIKEITEYYYDLPTKEPWKSTRKFFLVDKISGEMLADGNGDDTAAAKMVGAPEVGNLNITANIKEVLSIVL